MKISMGRCRSVAGFQAVAALRVGILLLSGLLPGWAAGDPSGGSATEGVDGCARLQRTFAECEVVLLKIAAEAGREPGALTLSVAGWRERPTGASATGPERWSARITPSFPGWVLRQQLAANAESLRDVVMTTPPGVAQPGEAVLLFHFPRARVLDLGPLRLELSARTQRHLVVAGQSEGPCSRRVLIIEEPHFDAAGQYALLEGLESLFTENRALLDGGQTAFLAEGCPAFQPLSIRPLVEADPRPDESLIRTVLGTYLIPGYIAFEWKHQRGIPVVGTEDPILYRISARVWTRLQQSANPVDLAVWPVTVAARNAAIAQSLQAQLRLRPCPILFVGGKHLESVRAEECLTAVQWHAVGKTMTEGDLGRLRSARLLGIGSLLQERGLGYYLLSTGSELRLGESADSTEAVRQYQRLFRAQLSRGLGEYLAACKAGKGVTVAPSPEAASQVVLASRSGDGNKDGGGDGNKDGGKSGKSGSSPKGMLDKLLGMLNKLFGDGQPPKDPSQPPGPGYEWRGKGPPGSGEGAWFNPDTKDSFRPHFGAGDHENHYDYSARGDSGNGWRIYTDGRVEAK